MMQAWFEQQILILIEKFERENPGVVVDNITLDRFPDGRLFCVNADTHEE
jgi:hypothetical protein